MVFLKPLLDPRDRIPERVFHYGVRKCAHFSEFALLGVSLYGLSRSLPRRRERGRLFPPLAGLGVAGLDELLQRFTQRTSSLLDVGIDFSGVLAGIGLAALIRLLYSRVRNKKKR